MATTTELLSSAYSLLESHGQLMKTIETDHNRRRALLSQLPSSCTAGVTLPELPTRSPSPEPPPPDNAPKNTREDYLEKERERQLRRTDLDNEKMAKVRRYRNYIPEEETIRNDYSQQCVDGGQWPQNWVLGAELERRFEEYPKQQRLLALKQAAVNAQAHPPTHLPLSSLTSLHPAKFDVILIDPPYATAGEASLNGPRPASTAEEGLNSLSQDISYGGGINWDQIASLPIPSLSADPSFIFLWVGHGNSDGLERGREVLAKWGFRRCEDIVWVKTNRHSNRGPGTDPPPIGGIMTRTTEHCLMGIRGTVRRSNDGWFVHCNIDTDVIIWEGDPTDPLRKPPELHALIENFCLGTRRLEIFGRPSSLRRGWVTVGDIDDAAFELEKVGGRVWEREGYEEELARLRDAATGKNVVATSPEIELLRPKSPNRPDKKMGNQQHQHHHQQPHQPNVNPNQQMQMRMGPPMGMGNPGMGGGFNNNHAGPMMVMQGGNMGMQSGGMNMPMQTGGMGAPGGGGFGGPIPGMAMAGQRGFDGQYPQMGMGMGMGPMGPNNAGMRPSQIGHVNPNMGMVSPGMGMGGGMAAPGGAPGLPTNAPIRLGGGPMQAMNLQNPINAGMNMGMVPAMNMGQGAVPMRVGGVLNQQQQGMGMMNNNNGMGMNPMQGMAGPGHGMMNTNMQMGGGVPQMHMGGMGMIMGPRMGGGGHAQFPNANPQWQGNQPQGGNWNPNGGGF